MNKAEEYIRAKLFSDYLTSSPNHRMGKAEKNIREKPSGWYYTDLAVATVTVLGLGFTWLSMIYQAIFYVPVIAFFAWITVLLCKKHYTERHSKPWRIVTGFIRAALYAAVLSAFAVPVIMSSTEPALYPVQKVIYSFNYVDRGERTLYFLPDNIPDDAGDYKIKMFPGLMQAEDYIRIEFFTSPGQLAEYRNFAQSCGAVKTEAICVNEMTGREETVESWKFHIYGERYAIYFICPESGFFMIVW